MFFFWIFILHSIKIYWPVDSSVTGRLSLRFYTISSRCQGWWYNYSLFKKSSFCFARIFRSHSNGFLWLVSDRCRSVLYRPLILSFYSFFNTFFIFKIGFVNRFEELREALEKLQLNDAALKVDSLTYLSILPSFIRLALIYCLSSIWSLEHIFPWLKLWILWNWLTIVDKVKCWCKRAKILIYNGIGRSSNMMRHSKPKSGCTNNYCNQESSVYT